MKLHTLRRTASAAVVGSVAFAGLMAVAPGANAAVTDGYFDIDASQGYSGSGCTTTWGGSQTAPTEPDSLTLLDNGGPFSRSIAETAVVSKDSPAESSTVTTSGSASVTATPIGAGPARITAVYAFDAGLSQPAGATCEARGSASAEGYFTFTLSAPMWLTISGSGSGSNGSAYASVDAAVGAFGASLTVEPRSSGSATAYLPAGKYYYSTEGGASVGTATDYDTDAKTVQTSASFRSTVTVALTPVGAGAAPVGKGKRFATLGERSCATNSVPVSIKKAAKNKAKSVVLTVNNKKRATFTQNAKPKKRLKARTAVLGGIAPAAPATVSAVVTLKNGKKVTVSRTYLPCS